MVKPNLNRFFSHTDAEMSSDFIRLLPAEPLESSAHLEAERSGLPVPASGFGAFRGAAGGGRPGGCMKTFAEDGF